MNERDPVDAHFLDAVAAYRPAAAHSAISGPAGDAPIRAGSGLTALATLEIFDAQAASRHLDFAARWLRANDAGFYTIGSSGHESNAAVAAAARPTDPALLHYRSGGFYLARSYQVPGHDGIRDVLLGLAGSTDEPIAGGRHKVFGHHGLAVIPQTSTIGSHLPRALGTAFAIGRARKLGVTSPWPLDAIAVCSFGDASANHSTTVGAIHAASWATVQGLPIPILFVCEDNGTGVSVRTPDGWIEAAYRNRPGIDYFTVDGFDTPAVFDVAQRAIGVVRTYRRPAFLHLRTVRFGGHAGSDVESAYRTAREIGADYEHDPLIGTAHALIDAGVLSPDQIIGRYEAMRGKVMTMAEEVARTAPRFSSATEVMSPLAPRRPDLVRDRAVRDPGVERRAAVFGAALPETEGPLTLALAINRTILDCAADRPGLIVFGEDVGRKGGVYGVTRGLQKHLGPARVFDTLLDEQTILGLALGGAISGLLPIPEIQYLAYLHNAEDQLRGEAATLSYFSQRQYGNPMVVRVAGLGYQKGFGGHFHNDNSVAALRDVPGLIIAVPARAEDAAAMLRTCVAAAEVDDSVCVFLEPIALYHTRDLYEPGDGAWLSDYARPQQWASTYAALGQSRTYGDGRDLTIVTFGNGVPMSLRVSRRLRASGIEARVVDLRWLAPLPAEDIVRHAEATGRVLIVDETRRTAGLSEAIAAVLVDAGFTGSMSRVCSEDSFIPLGEAANLVLVGEDQIEKAAFELSRSG